MPSVWFFWDCECGSQGPNQMDQKLAVRGAKLHARRCVIGHERRLTNIKRFEVT